MNNWRLLLLAVVVVVQFIGSFTETNLIDGRECSECSKDRFYGYSKTEEHRSLDGIREDRRTSEERRLSSLDENRDLRYETRRAPTLTRSERSLKGSEIRISPELNRFSKDQVRHSRVTGLRVTRESLNNNRDESRSAMVQNERDFHESRNRDTLDAARTVRHSRDAKNGRSIERESRNTMSRLPIRTNRNIEEGSNKETTTLQRKPEKIVRSDTLRDARLSGATPSDSRIQLDDNRERTTTNRRTQNEESRRARFWNARSEEARAERKLDEENDRDSRVVRVELRRQRDIKLMNRVSAAHRDSERISADRMREPRDAPARLFRDRMDAKNNWNMDRRSLSMDSLSTIRKSRDNRLSKAFDRDTRNERTARMRDESSDEKRLQRVSSRLSRARMQESNRIVARRDARESSEERRQQRDNSPSRERTSFPLRGVRDTEQIKESDRTIRESSEERRLQRDSSRLFQDRTLSRLRENREFRDNTELTQESHRITSQSSTEINSRKIDSQSRQYIGDSERPDLRRQVLDRSMERAIRMTHSTSAERRYDISKPRASRSAETSRVRDDTRTNERDEHRQTHDLDRTIEQGVIIHQQPDTTRSSRTENIRLNRAVRQHDDIRGSGDRVMTVDRTMVQRVSRNVAQRFDSRSLSKMESIRLERQVRNRAEVRETEKREMQRDDNRTSRILLNRRLSERVLEERRQEYRDATKDSRDVRSEMSRHRGDVKKDERSEFRRQRDAFSNTSDRVLAERRQENLKTDSRNVRLERRSIVEARSGKVLAERRLENRDTRNVRDENKRHDTRRQRDAIRQSRGTFSRHETRDVTERLTARFRESTARAETRNERATRNIERQVRSDKSLRTAEGQRESKSFIRANAMERMEKTTSHLPARDNANWEEARFRNIDATFRNSMDSVEKSDESVFSNWQMMFYTLQGVYLCGLLVQILTENTNKTQKRTFNWWNSPKNLLKVD